jgi:hypothetical protein
MFHIFRAFAWMHWRVLLNSLGRTSARDTLERLSIAVEQLGPIIATVMLVPTLLIITSLALYTGFLLAGGSAPSFTFTAIRFVTLSAMALSIVGPIALPASERTNAVRLLLLPIPRRTLYVALAAGTLSDPWTGLTLPALMALPAGLMLGGAWMPALLALGGGLLLILALIGLSMLTTNAVHLLVRDRRRGEMLALLFIVIIPALGLLPGLMESRAGRHTRETAPAARSDAGPSWLRETGQRVFAVLPSELYLNATRGAVDPNEAAAGVSGLLGLAVSAIAIHGLGLIAFSHLLDSPSTTGPRRTGGGTRVWRGTLPWLTPGASAVALGQLRLAFRTPRGRSILLSPMLLFLILVFMIRRSGGSEFSLLMGTSGLRLAAFGSFVCLISILPFAMNQFAIDKAGLTLVLLSPLTESELLLGKAVGNAAIVVGPALICIFLAFGVFPGGSAALWLNLPLALVATYLLAAPAAAALSATFPRAVDLNSIRRGSNPHGAAALAGLAAFAAAGLPPAALTSGTIYLFHRPDLAPLLMLAWCAIALVISRLLFVLVRRLVVKRRENLALSV